MTYYTYGACIGTTKDEIIKTAEYYVKERGQKEKIPTEKDIREIPDLRIECWYPMCGVNHWMDIDILPDFKLSINANAFMDVIEQVVNFDSLKRGELYKFYPNHKQMYLLPEKIVKAMKEFDWQPYARKAGEMMGELQNKLAGAPNVKCNNLEDNLLQLMQHKIDESKAE